MLLISAIAKNVGAYIGCGTMHWLPKSGKYRSTGKAYTKQIMQISYISFKSTKKALESKILCEQEAAIRAACSNSNLTVLLCDKH